MSPAEEWRAVVGFDGYEVSNYGGVRSFLRDPSGRPIAQHPAHRLGYLGVNLWRGGRAHPRKTHRLVAEAFIGPCPPGFECGHRDGNPTNNVAWNLAWITKAENGRDRVRHGRVRRGTKHQFAKLDDAAVFDIRVRSAAGERQVDIAKRYEIDRSVVSMIATGKLWSHVGGPTRAPLKSRRYRRPDLAEAEGAR